LSGWLVDTTKRSRISFRGVCVCTEFSQFDDASLFRPMDQRKIAQITTSQMGVIITTPMMKPRKNNPGAGSGRGFLVGTSLWEPGSAKSTMAAEG